MTEETTAPKHEETRIWMKPREALTQEERDRWRPQTRENSEALERIFQQHKLWLDTNGIEGAPINLNHQDLSGATLVATILNGARAPGVQLVKAEMRGANLHEANLEDADISQDALKHAAIRGKSEGTFTARMFPERDRADEPLWELDPRDHLKRSR